MAGAHTDSWPAEMIEALYPLMRRIELAILENNIDKAQQLCMLRDKYLNGEPEYDASDPLSAPIAAMQLGVKVTNMLENDLHLHKVVDLLKLRPDKLYGVRGFSTKTCEKILEASSVWRRKVIAAGQTL